MIFYFVFLYSYFAVTRTPSRTSQRSVSTTSAQTTELETIEETESNTTKTGKMNSFILPPIFCTVLRKEQKSGSRPLEIYSIE